MKGFETTQPASQREMMKQIETLVEAFEVAEKAIDTTNDWTVSNLEPRAYGVEQYFRGHPKTNILLRELKHALSAYREGAEQMKLILSGPKRGPTNEYALRVVSVVKTVLDRSGITLDHGANGTLTLTISIAFEALGIAKGEPRQYAAKVLAPPD